MATFIDLYADSGADFTANVYANTNLSGYSVSSVIRKSYYSANSSANFSCSFANTINGNVVLTLLAANSVGLIPGTYVYDVKASNANTNSTIRIQEGMITFSGFVTGGPSQTGVP